LNNAQVINSHTRGVQHTLEMKVSFYVVFAIGFYFRVLSFSSGVAQIIRTAVITSMCTL